VQLKDGSWIPLWFGNEHTPDENNPVYGTAQVVNHLSGSTQLASQFDALIQCGRQYLRSARKVDGSFGGDANAPASIEETAVALHALSGEEQDVMASVQWLIAATENGTRFPTAPIGLYFARLWYHEQLYPVVWTLGALRAARRGLLTSEPLRNRVAVHP
jgi:squalene-hopene/tetraprenyl-beta-curcumene cyclase